MGIDWDAVKPDVEKLRDSVLDVIKTGLGELADPVKGKVKDFLESNAEKIAIYNYMLRYGDDVEKDKADTILAAYQSQASTAVASALEDASDTFKDILSRVLKVVAQAARVILPKLL